MGKAINIIVGDDASSGHQTKKDSISSSSRVSAAGGAGSDALKGEVVRQGFMRMETGSLLKRKMVPVYVELRDENICCFNSDIDREIVDSMMLETATVQAGERKGSPCITLKKQQAEGSRMRDRFAGHELVLAFETQDEMQRWFEIVEACCQKAHTQAMVKRMMQEDKSAAVRAEADKYKKELQEAARQRQQQQLAVSSAAAAAAAAAASQGAAQVRPPARPPARPGFGV